MKVIWCPVCNYSDIEQNWETRIVKEVDNDPGACFVLHIHKGCGVVQISPEEPEHEV